MKRSRSLRTLAFLCPLLVLLSGCDLASADESSILGVWKFEDEPGVYLDIKTREILVYDYDSDDRCYDEDRVAIVSQRGSLYQYRSDDGDGGEAEIVRDGNRLTITEDGESFYYSKSSQTLRPLCAN